MTVMLVTAAVGALFGACAAVAVAYLLHRGW